MKKRPGSAFAGVLGASAALGGVLANVPCSAAGCASCLRCASLGIGTVVVALLLRRRPGSIPLFHVTASRPEVACQEEGNQDLRNQEESCR